MASSSVTFQDIVRWLLPREDQFFRIMESQAAVAREAAIALATFGDATVSAEDVRTKVQAIEHRGDVLSHQLEDALDRTFVTPIDREDIQKLSSELDDVIDLMNHAARSFSLFDVAAPSDAMRAQMKLLIEATACLEATVPLLGQSKFEQLRDKARELKAMEKDGDTAFRAAIAELFRDPTIDAKQLLKQKELLEVLESALDRCEDVAELLAHLAVKHG
jgi:hypothetical protein